MYEDFKEDIKVKDEKAIVNKALGDAINTVKNDSTITVNAHPFVSISELIRNVEFNFPTVSYLIVVNFDKIDKNGFPTTAYHQIKKAITQATKEQVYLKNRKITSERITEALFKCDLATAVIMKDLYRVYLTNIHDSIPYNEILYKIR